MPYTESGSKQCVAEGAAKIRHQKEYEQEEMNLAADADAARQPAVRQHQIRESQWVFRREKKGALLEIPIQDMVPYLVFHRDVTNQEFLRLADLLKPWGVPCFVWP